MATQPLHRVAVMGALRLYLRAAGSRAVTKLRNTLQLQQEELRWLKGQLAVANKVNARISDVNELYCKQLDDLKGELEEFRTIDPNSMCRACGARSGRLRAMVDPGSREVVVQKTCNVCGFPQAHGTIASDAFQVYQPGGENSSQSTGKVLNL